MIALLLIALAAMQSVAAEQRADSIAVYLREHQRPPLAELLEAARAHQVVLVGDVHPAAAPKRLVADLLRLLHAQDLVDAVALEVPMTQQLAIREYLASDPEDVDILLEHPLLLRSHWGESREFLEIYRTVWRLNRVSEGGRALQILAVDAPRGPPAASSRRAALARYVNRDAIMELKIRRWLENHAGGRILVFVGDLHTLKGVEANLDVEGEFARLVPLATRLDRLLDGEVFAAFSDASVRGHSEGASRVFPYATPIFQDVDGGVAIRPGGPLARIAQPIRLDLGGSALTIEILPKSYTLDRVTDLYVFFGMSDELTPIDVER